MSLWVAYVLRFYATSWFHLAYMVDPFRNYQRLFVVIMPFGLTMLDLQGFYQSALKKEYLAFRREIFSIGCGSGSISRFYCALFPAVSTGSGAK